MISNNNQNGQILLLAITAVGVVLFTTLLTIGGAMLYSQNSIYSTQSEKTIALAEAGINKALASLNKSGGSYNGETETLLGEGSYSVVITNQNTTTKTIESTAYLPSKANPKIKRTVKVTASKGIGTAFNYGIQIGEGGMQIAKDSIINGSVYSNGNINMATDTKITGDVYVAGGTAPVANQGAECQDSNCTGFIFGKNVSGNNQFDVAQSFKPTISNVLNKVGLKLKKTGTPSNLTVRILGNSAGGPNKNQVLASGTLSANLVTTTYPSTDNFIEVAFSTPPNLISDTTYWIVLDGSENPNNYWAWSQDLAQSYTRGTAMWSGNWNASNPVWNNISGDLGFEVFMGGVATYIQGNSGVIIQGNAHANTLRDLTIQGGAYYQTAQNITAGQSYPGAVDPPAQTLPISQVNIDDWKTQATSAGIFNGDITTCPVDLPAGKYIGSITFPEGCVVTTGSPLWVTGNLDLQIGVTIKLNQNFQASSGVFMVDNFITLDKDDKILGSGTDGSYLVLISNFNSRDDPSSRNAITVAKEGNSGILYSNLGSISIAKENELTSVTGWKLNIDKELELSYDQGLAGTFFSSGPAGSFSLLKGTYQAK